jgi:predicted methyltransferase
MIFLQKTYKKFIAFYKNCFLKESENWFGVEKTSQKIKIDFLKNYYNISFYNFLTNVKNLVFTNQVFDFIKKGWGDNWELALYLEFLTKEKIIFLRKDKLFIQNKNFFDFIPLPKTEDEIKNAIKKKTGLLVQEKESVNDFIGNFNKFKVKGEWDQLPLSQSSAVFLIKKFLEYIPLKKKFLFVGDDDFLSIFLSLADREIESIVIDADKELLNSIDIIKSKFNLKIETRLIDTRKKNKLNEDFVGFACNPPCTEKGVKNFLNYGLNNLGTKGGNIFLTIGNENIGNRILFLQKWFSQKNLAINEVIIKKIFYPYLEVNEKEDKNNFFKMKKYFSEKTIKENPRLGADLWVLNYIPFNVKRIKNNNSIYSYL